MNSAEASQWELSIETPVAHETPVAARAFLSTLRRLDRDLTIPVPDRLRILRELEFDLEELWEAGATDSVDEFDGTSDA